MSADDELRIVKRCNACADLAWKDCPKCHGTAWVEVPSEPVTLYRKFHIVGMEFNDDGEVETWGEPVEYGAWSTQGPKGGQARVWRTALALVDAGAGKDAGPVTPSPEAT
jgi:hypothetical protein